MTATPPDRIEHLRIERGDDAFSRLTQAQRLRLMVQVLCELVAYDEDTETSVDETVISVEETARTDQLTERIAS